MTGFEPWYTHLDFSKICVDFASTSCPNTTWVGAEGPLIPEAALLILCSLPTGNRDPDRDRTSQAEPRRDLFVPPVVCLSYCTCLIRKARSLSSLNMPSWLAQQTWTQKRLGGWQRSAWDESAEQFWVAYTYLSFSKWWPPGVKPGPKRD